MGAAKKIFMENVVVDIKEVPRFNIYGDLSPTATWIRDDNWQKLL